MVLPFFAVLILSAGDFVSYFMKPSYRISPISQIKGSAILFSFETHFSAAYFMNWELFLAGTPGKILGADLVKLLHQGLISHIRAYQSGS